MSYNVALRRLKREIKNLSDNIVSHCAGPEGDDFKFFKNPFMVRMIVHIKMVSLNYQ